MKKIRKYFRKHPKIAFTIDFVATGSCLLIGYWLLPGFLGTCIAVAGILIIRGLLGTYWSDKQE
ncbi:hypothetical protein OZL92_01410 [Bacillus sonorensis]|uniref:Uncharacterized protein n=2 Tax=Bacillus sonorensis TaxID=119858 RepID=M5P6Y1_9BACI|nr:MULTISPECIES: hypothetical protein [Bacillus]ASB88033.1 hypothetical protein S101395_01524 [Bacillus sonorensis]EME75203.1 hypothetical protein BSONL12_09457 [Bacillus sonorensis L12]MBG9915914.1 hypothetical protein [Bacillus sonorensis]MCY8026126.1 hypothetical protein [Bacillus sonorensis]MCY8603349.1 hypothetical protein [Bacillus sonorensis]